MGLEERLDALAELFHQRSAEQFVVTLFLAEELSWLYFLHVCDQGGDYQSAVMHAYRPYMLVKLAFRDSEDQEVVVAHWERQRSRVDETWQQGRSHEQGDGASLPPAVLEELWRKPAARAQTPQQGDLE